MTGDDKIRLCGQCDRNVHNISGMNEREAAQTILSRESGRLCTYYRRNADGSVHVDNCPEILKAARDKVYALVAGVLLCAIISIRYSAACSIAVNNPLAAPLVPFYIGHDAVIDIGNLLRESLAPYDPQLKEYGSDFWTQFGVAIAQVIFFFINLIVFLAPINRECKRSLRRYIAGALVAFGGPTAVHLIGTFLINNFGGGLGGGI